MKKVSIDWEDDTFTGVVEVNVPAYVERIKLQREMANATKDDEDNEAATEAAILAAQETIVSIDLALKADKKKKFKDVEELGLYQEGLSTILKIGRIKYSGVPLSRDSEKPSEQPPA